ncbi:MAG: YdcF family protein [Pirellulales bacterium]|nr:YdcF family protein [Pirellulales bacterium]
MYHFLSALFRPLPLGFLAALVALVWAWRKRAGHRRGLVGLAVVWALFALSCTELVAHVAVWTLERHYPPDAPLPERAGAIVILSAGTRVFSEQGDCYDLDVGSAFRCVHAARLYHRLGQPPIIASGGKVRANEPGPLLAEAMAGFLVELGVDRSDIILEDASRTTYENAVETAAILADRKLTDVVLVTDATHMARGVRCFRAAGVDVVPSACNHRNGLLRWSADVVIPSDDAAAAMESAFHEWIGLAWYWLHGRLG